MKRVGILIIGDEILDGSVEDSNSAFLTRRIAAAGSQVSMILVLPDDPEVIAGALPAMVKDNDFVITSGGIGPTPDDRTFEAISLAFDTPLAPQPTLVSIVERRFQGDERTWAMRMACPPEGVELIQGGAFAWPLIRYRDVFILPGVPQILEDKFDLIEPHLLAEAFHRGILLVRARESSYADQMDALSRAHPEVRIGSYPILAPEPHVRLVVRSKDPAAAREVLLSLADLFEEDAKIDVQLPDFT